MICCGNLFVVVLGEIVVVVLVLRSKVVCEENGSEGRCWSRCGIRRVLVIVVVEMGEVIVMAEKD